MLQEKSPAERKKKFVFSLYQKKVYASGIISVGAGTFKRGCVPQPQTGTHLSVQFLPLAVSAAPLNRGILNVKQTYASSKGPRENLEIKRG